MRLPAIPRGVADFGLRSLRRFVDIEGAQRAIVIAAQAFTSLIPFLVVASALGPGRGDLGDRIVERFSLDGDSARSVKGMFNDTGEVERTITWVGVVILVVATLSFSRAMQRMFQRAYGVAPRGRRDLFLGLAWLAGFAVWVAVSSPLRDWFRDLGGQLIPLAVSALLGLVLWLWTPAILLGIADWRRLLPGAMVSGVLGAIAGVASGIYIPILLKWSADKYGLIGIAFSMQSWLLVMAFVVVIGAVVGAVASDLYGDRIQRMTRRKVREVGG